MSEVFQHGPFIFAPGQRAHIAGEPTVQWTMSYGAELLAQRRLPEDANRTAVIEHFDEDRADFIRTHKPASAPADNPLVHGYTLRLVCSTPVTGEAGSVIDEFLCLAPVPGLSAGMIDDRYPTWAWAGGGCVPMCEEEFARLKAAHEAIRDALTAGRRNDHLPRHAWIASLLSADVLTLDPAEWRAPSSWEIRHIIGEGSFTGISGAGAAALVGIMPQSFRKYTARDDARTHQSISFAIWHLLLQRLGIQRLNDENQP